MGYDIHLVNQTGATLYVSDRHQISGGTYAVGGITECWINITYNYSEHFYRVFGVEGIRTIYGMNALDSIPVITKAIQKLGDDVSSNYWEATEGNAKEALKNLIRLALLRPDGTWRGD